MAVPRRHGTGEIGAIRLNDHTVQVQSTRRRVAENALAGTLLLGMLAAPQIAGGQSVSALPPVVAIPNVAGTPATPQARYVFPVFGEAATFSNDYGAPRAGTGWHHGTDIFAPIGTPVLALADGEISSVGVNSLGGNRLWLRDGLGNTYYYAHLSAYASHIADGVRVRAGEIIAFVGNTGQAITTPPHLHFEIHPGDGASINPYPYLQAWRHEADVAQAFVDAPSGERVATSPVGAVLVGFERESGPSMPTRSGDGRAVAVP